MTAIILQHNIKDKIRGSRDTFYCQQRESVIVSGENSVDRRTASDNSDGMEQVLTT